MNLKPRTLTLAALVTMLGCAALTACKDKVKLEEKTSESDHDSTDETATSAPPAPEADPQGSPPSAHDVWVGGNWHYTGGHYRWARGRWEAPRPGFRLVQARWEASGGRWMHHPARWEHEHR